MGTWTPEGQGGAWQMKLGEEKRGNKECPGGESRTKTGGEGKEKKTTSRKRVNRTLMGGE